MKDITTNMTTNDSVPETLSPLVFTSLGVYLVVAGVVGVVANGVALFIFFKNKRLRSPTNTFIIGLLCSDILMCLVGIPLPAASNLANRWVFGWSGCVVSAFAVYFLGLSNLYILAAISVDRYIVISKPLKAVYITKRVAVVSLLMCYLFGFLWSSVPFFGWSSFAFEGAGTSCAISYDYLDSSAFSYNITIFINCFIIPFVIMIVCYYFVFKTVKSISKNSMFGKTSRAAKKNMMIERKLAKTIAIMIGVYAFAWTPYAITAFWEAFGMGKLPMIIATIPAMFAKTASVWNPFIYVFSNNEFRKCLLESIPIMQRCFKNKEEDHDNQEPISTISRLPDDTTTRVSNTNLNPNRRTGVGPMKTKQQNVASNTCDSVSVITLETSQV